MSVTEIGKRLKLARQQAHITQAEVAKRLGVSFQTISSYERGINRWIAIRSCGCAKYIMFP